MEKQEKVSSHRYLEEIVKAEALMNSGKYNEALLLLNRYEEEGKLNTLENFSIHLFNTVIWIVQVIVFIYIYIQRR